MEAEAESADDAATRSYGGRPPYVAFKAFDEFARTPGAIEPGKLIEESLAEFVQRSTVRSELRNALRWLGLVDGDGCPGMDLIRYARHKEQRSSMLEVLLQLRYGAPMEMATKTSEGSVIARAFDPPLQPGGTSGRSVSFLLAAMKAAGLKVGPRRALQDSMVSGGPDADDGKLDDRYRASLLEVVESLTATDLADQQMFDRWEAACERYERWAAHKTGP